MDEDDEEEIDSTDNDLVILKVGLYILKEWMKKIWRKKRIFRILSACCSKVNILYYWEISISIKPECSSLDKANSFAIIFTYNEKRIPFSSSK